MGSIGQGMMRGQCEADEGIFGRVVERQGEKHDNTRIRGQQQA